MLSAIQAFLSLFVQAASLVRRWLVRHRLRSTTRLPRPVVSIGNLSFGGTGKTPVVIALARALAARSLSVVVLTRGYRRAKGRPTELVDPNGSFETFGDEPLLIARRAGVPVVVDANRARGAEWALARLAPDVFLLDDGFSHLALARDLDWVMLGRRDLATFVRRREPRRSLRHAHVVASFEREVSHAPPALIALERRAASVLDAAGRRPPSALVGQRVIAMAAIANPERFSAELARLGARLVRTAFFHDHHAFPPGTLAAAASECEAGLADAVVITEKDAIKLESLPRRVWVLESEAVLPDALVERVAALARPRNAA